MLLMLFLKNYSQTQGHLDVFLYFFIEVFKFAFNI